MVPKNVTDLEEGFMVHPKVMVKNSVAVWKGIQLMVSNLKSDVSGEG